jgi:phenylpyruvate tautomerase PptA (4-oxalocrotonate tautomerase family)
MSDGELPIPIVAGVPMAQILDLIGMRRITGKIQIGSHGDLFGLFVERGSIIAATSPLRSLRLGHLLLQRGAVEPAFLHDVLVGRRSVPRNVAIGGALVAEGATTRASLLATVEEQITEILARVIGLEDATVVVIADEPLPDGIERAAFDLNELLAEADRRHARRATVRAMQRLLPQADKRLMVKASLGLISRQLSDAELLVALQIDKGGMSLDRLGTSLPLEPVKLKRTVIGLLEREIIAVRD